MNWEAFIANKGPTIQRGAYVLLLNVVQGIDGVLHVVLMTDV